MRLFSHHLGANTAILCSE